LSSRGSITCRTRSLRTSNLIADLHEPPLRKIRRDRHIDRLRVERIGAPALRQVDVQPLLHHGRCDHEDHQQYQHHVDQGHDVDFSERRRHSRAARAAGTAAYACLLNFRHR
jgi:hypothetical protein